MGRIRSCGILIEPVGWEGGCSNHTATHDPIDCSYIRFEYKFGKGICIETLVVFGYMQIFRYKEMDKESCVLNHLLEK